MPIVIQKKNEVPDWANPLQEVPFDGGQTVDTAPYSDENFEKDLKDLAKAAPKRSELAEEIKKLAAKVAEFDVIWKPVEERVLAKVLQKFGPVEGDKEIDVTINKVHVKVGKDSKVREVTDKAALASALGEEVFFDLAKIPLGDIDKYTTPGQQDAFLKVGWNGKRKLTVQAIGKGTVVPTGKKE